MSGAAGKITLCGEHFVLHGGPALALSWGGGELRLRPAAEGTCHGDPAWVARLSRAWNVARGVAGLPPAPACPFAVESTIPPGVGLGSSAALSVSLVDAAVSESGSTWGDRDRIVAATKVEDVFHGRSSGMDPAVVVLRRPVLIEAGGALRPLTWRFQGPEVVLAIAPGDRRTAEAVESAGRFAAAQPGRFEALRDAAAGLVLEVAALVEAGARAGDVARLGGLLTGNHGMLRELGVSSEALDRLVDGALAAGALGAKLCGAGLGGIVLALPPAGGIAAVEAALTRAGAARVMRWRMVEPGRGPT